MFAKGSNVVTKMTNNLQFEDMFIIFLILRTNSLAPIILKHQLDDFLHSNCFFALFNFHLICYN